MRKKSLSGIDVLTGAPTLSLRSSPSGALVDLRLETLRRLEREDPPGRDLDLVARLRVAAFARGLPAEPEVPEPDDLHVAPLLEGADHGVEHRLDHRGRLPLGEAMRSHRVDEVILGQRDHPLGTHDLLTDRGRRSPRPPSLEARRGSPQPDGWFRTSRPAPPGRRPTRSPA